MTPRFTYDPVKNAEAVDYGTDTGDAQVGGGHHAGVILGLGLGA